MNRKPVQRLMQQMGLRAVSPNHAPVNLEGAQDLSLSAERPEHHAAESGLGERHLLYPDGQGIHVSDCHYGLILTPSAGVAGLEYVGG